MPQFTLWGVTASPYQLKMQSLLDYSGHGWRRWPESAGRWSALATAFRVRRAVQTGRARRYPRMNTALDEYPAVPFYTFDDRQFFYDSSSLAVHLDEQFAGSTPALIPAEADLAFLCSVIDEAFDEFGLYMVHHMRWVGSAATTRMGDFTAREFGSLLPPGFGPLLARRLYRRQARRCPYLFSVAPEGFDVGMGPGRSPPAIPGFPPTHDLLESCWRRCLALLEQLLAQRPYVLGGRFTLADASVYGQLGMNLVDGAAADLMRELAPATWRWLCAIRDGEHATSRGELSAGKALQPLLGFIGDTFVPLMQQNEAAYDRAVNAGETLFNEQAFDAGRALYDGELLGHPFRSVAKSFQVGVWRDLKHRWAALQPVEQEQIMASMPTGIALALSKRAA